MKTKNERLKGLINFLNERNEKMNKPFAERVVEDLKEGVVFFCPNCKKRKEMSYRPVVVLCSCGYYMQEMKGGIKKWQ
ncbi:MAG: hypothetical protein KatS3mg096_695 [Candidatus Parcubacteria bacterium]|nr:MAG: hypothetical protein KatS3mg096_668 [Candidatus Parcubacteria bacterium]GIW67827.1 MAG: hypothetical protein KatS3mg096_695 [Candidatus Parcubacteria bacterium]